MLSVKLKENIDICYDYLIANHLLDTFLLYVCKEIVNQREGKII